MQEEEARKSPAEDLSQAEDSGREAGQDEKSGGERSQGEEEVEKSQGEEEGEEKPKVETSPKKTRYGSLCAMLREVILFLSPSEKDGHVVKIDEILLDS